MTDTMVAENPRAVIGNNAPPSLLEILAQKHAVLTPDIEAIAERANATPKEIKSDADLASVGTVVKDARALSKRIDKLRVEEKEPFLTSGKQVDAHFKTLLDRLERIASVLDERATAYNRQKAAEARRKAEAEARARDEEAARQRQIAADEAARNRPNSAAKHADLADEAETQAAIATSVANTATADLTRVRSEGSTVSATGIFNFEIVDFSKVDLEALRPYLPRADVEKAIRQFVRINKGAAQLSGVRIFEDVKTNYR